MLSRSNVLTAKTYWNFNIFIRDLWSLRKLKSRVCVHMWQKEMSIDMLHILQILKNKTKLKNIKSMLIDEFLMQKKRNFNLHQWNDIALTNAVLWKLQNKNLRQPAQYTSHLCCSLQSLFSIALKVEYTGSPIPTVQLRTKKIWKIHNKIMK